MEPVGSPVSVMGECAKRAPSQTPWTTARVLWRSAHCTSCRQCKEAMRAVVQSCGDAKLDWITPLTRACIDGRTECVCELLKPPEVECHNTTAEVSWRHQWMIDFADSERHTALHAACAFGYEDCVRLLIQAGATLDMADDEGDTPLDGEASPHGVVRLWEGVCRPASGCRRQGDAAGLGHAVDARLSRQGRSVPASMSKVHHMIYHLLGDGERPACKSSRTGGHSLLRMSPLPSPS